MLDSLPSELLDLIIGQIASRRDLRQLTEVCMRLRDCAIPHLYRSIAPSAPEISLNELATRIEEPPRKYIKYTQELCLNIPIHERVDLRCVHHNGNGGYLAEFRTDEDDAFLGEVNYEFMGNELTDQNMVENNQADPFSKLMDALNSLQLRDNQLRSFRWELGTCLPKDLLSGNETSPLRNQTAIRSIALITDIMCGGRKSTQFFVYLVQFKDLENLVWRGLQRYSHFESVRNCFRAHNHRIRSLTLDLVNWNRVEEIWIAEFCEQITGIVTDNFLAEKVLDISPGGRGIILSALEHLQLSDVSFFDASVEMMHAFNMDNLKSLKLRKCPYSLNLLQHVICSGKSMSLKEFEFVLVLGSLPRDAHIHITETIRKFIEHAHRLEMLSLMLPEPFDWSVLTKTISCCSHLRSFVMHHLVNRAGQYLIDGGIPWTIHWERVLKGNKLVYFGCSTPPDELTSQLQRTQSRPLCRLLHVRASGVVLDRRTSSKQKNWSSAAVYQYKYGDDLPYEPRVIFRFSIDGLPNLEILAWGDFSYEGRYSKFNLIFCKSGSGYRFLNYADQLFSDLVLDYEDMLAACPFDDIME